MSLGSSLVDTMAQLDALETEVRSWPWVRERLGPGGTLAVLTGAACGMGLPLPVVTREQSRYYPATVSANVAFRERGDVPPGCLRAYVAEDAVPLVAGLLALWAAASCTGRPVPRELDALVCGALCSGQVSPRSLGVSWGEVALLFRGREVPEQVLARATVELLRERPERSEAKVVSFGMSYAAWGRSLP